MTCKTGQTDTTFLIHGEEDSMSAFTKTLTRTSIVMPTLRDEYEL